LATALSAISGCLPRGPISIGWPWRHSSTDCPDCDSANGLAVNAPHSLFHPVPTRPVFTPWLVDDPKPTPPGTVAAHRPDEKSLDKREIPPSDSELADRRPAVRSAAARSSAPTSTLRSESSSTAPTAADEYYNPSSESAGGSQAAPSNSSSGQPHANSSGQ